MSDLIWKPVKIKLGQIEPWQNNPRLSTKAQAERLIQSERELGQAQTFAIGPANESGRFPLYDGHQRYGAWMTVKGADYEMTALQSNRPLSEDERRKMSILLHTATGSWDWNTLSGWGVSELKDWGLVNQDNIKGWNNDANNVKELLKSEQGGKGGDEPPIDRAAELLEKWKVQTGDLWQIGDHRLICGDCTDPAAVARVMDGEKAGACVTDSPYGINREGIENDDPEGLRELFDGCLAVMPITDGVIINFQSPRLFPVWLDAVRAAGHKFERALWMYKENDVTFPWRGWLMTAEIIIISSLGNPEWGEPNEYRHDTMKIEWGKEVDGIHKTGKPLDVIGNLIENTAGDVYEPFSGSGTTLVACQNLGRKCRAVEISPAYVSVALERMSTAFPDLDIKRL